MTPDRATGAAASDIESLVPLFDPSHIDVLRRDLGAATMRELLAQCLTTMEEHLAELRRCASLCDQAATRRLAHDLKGVCAQFGATRASALARRIELELEDPAAVTALIPQLADSIVGAGAKIREITIEI
jgi:HPt (histidine-containing phosphotransfer) domain-containing protein